MVLKVVRPGADGKLGIGNVFFYFHGGIVGSWDSG